MERLSARHHLPMLLLIGAALVIVACGRTARPTPTPTFIAPAATPSPTPSASPRASLSDEDAVALARRFDGAAAHKLVEALADPSYMGRHVGTEGELKGAQFLAERFKEAGLAPGGEGGSFLQPFPLQVQELAAPPVLSLTDAVGQERTLRLRDDYRPIYGGLAGGGDVRGPGLFAGNGSDLSGLDVKGKVLHVVPRGRLADIVSRARAAGALGVIVTTGQATLMKGEGRPPDASAIPVAEVSQAGAASLLEGSGHTREELNERIRSGQPLAGFPLKWTVRLAVPLRPPENVTAHNVIGVLEGQGNPDEAVVVGAHYEEIGPDPDGTVYPAANDNASGTAVLVGLARLLKESGFRPRRTVIFVAWSGHEEGLFGSRFYAEHPVRPMSKTRLYLNLDTVGQGAAAELEAVPQGAEARSLLDEALDLLKKAGEAPPVSVLGQPAGASDDSTFRDAGVPALSFEWGGLFEDGRIHTPADTADTVDAAKLKVTGLVSALALLLAAR
ncbi:MAG: M28 family peptidase [Chloroflexi bacterium]|nr:M28 family peptidase [Chloroflexota bacterium]